LRLAVFTGSSAGRDPSYADAASRLGTELGQAGVGVVYGGGRVGLMGVLADAVLAAGGEVIGVMPRHLVEREIAHGGLTRLETVEGMHQRKARMAELADGFVALPGGAGTLEEWFEAWTWCQLGLHCKPIALVNTIGFFDPLLGFLNCQVDAGFLAEEYRQAVIVAADASELLAAIEQWVPPTRKWQPDPAATLQSVAWVCVQDGRLLVVRTQDRDAFYLPGGKPEQDESDAEALIREIREELGLSMDPATIQHHRTILDVAHGQPERQLRMVCYTAEATGQPVPGQEIAEVAWLSAADAHRCAPAVRQVLSQLLLDDQLTA
jgi:uncharacterized protein (TIGR00730 family)